MSFRSKTIIGIALIEVIILMILIFNSLNFLRDSNRDALKEMANSTVRIMVAIMKDPLISSNLATLDSFALELIAHSKIRFIKIYDVDNRLLIEKSQLVSTAPTLKKQNSWLDFYIPEDTFLVESQIAEMGQQFGRVVLGVSDEEIDLLLMQAQNKFIALAISELMLSALFSYILGWYLTGYLKKLNRASKHLAAGDMGYQVDINGLDELAQTALAFNQMSSHLQSTYQQLEIKEQRMSSILNHIVDGVMTIDQYGLIISLNPAAEKLFGFTEQELQGKPVTLLIREQYHEQWLGNLQGTLSKNTLTQTIEGRNKKGFSFSMEFSIGCMIIDQGICFSCIVRDISERINAEKSMLMKCKVFENTSEAIIVTDANSRIIDVNSAYERVMGYSLEEVMGADPKITHSKRHDVSFYQTMCKSLDNEGCWEGEIWGRRKNGEIFPSWLTINSIMDINNVVTNYVAIFKDITQQKNNEQQLEKLAHYDLLTGLANRVLFADRLKHELEYGKRNKTKAALLFIDLDRFKQVNDTLGHNVGDELLVQVSARLNDCIRESDTVARLGGDEFTVILSDIASFMDVQGIATQIIQQLTTAFMIEQQQVEIGASIGISIYPDHGCSPEVLIKNADIAMYQAKDGGRGMYVSYSPEAVEVEL